MLNQNLVKLYVHCEINETIEMTFKIDTWHINCKFKKNFWKKKNSEKNFLENLKKKKKIVEKKIFKKIVFLKNC